jgi:hypothetical protein
LGVTTWQGAFVWDNLLAGLARLPAINQQPVHGRPKASPIGKFAKTYLSIHDFLFAMIYLFLIIILLKSDDFIVFLDDIGFIGHYIELVTLDIHILPDDFIGHDKLLRVGVKLRCPKFHG